MKQHSLFLLLFTVSILSAQRKTELGFTVRTGMVTLTETSSDYNPYWRQETGVRPGLSMGFGGYGKLRLGRRWALSAELNWTFMQANSSQFYSDRHRLDKQPAPVTEYTTKRTIGVHSLMLPLQVHFSPFAGNRLSFSLGAVAHRILARNFSSAVHYSADSAPAFVIPEDGIEFDSDTHLLLTGGMEFRINTNTSVGLGLTVRPGGERAHAFYGFCGTGATSFPYMAVFNPKNLSVSVRHSVLR